MRLGDRLKGAPEPDQQAEGLERVVLPGPETRRHDPFLELKQRAQEGLYRRLGSRLTDPSMDERELRVMRVVRRNGSFRLGRTIRRFDIEAPAVETVQTGTAPRRAERNAVTESARKPTTTAPSPEAAGSRRGER